jgi:LysW-gamma-L-lysine carboxypeptidase
VTFSDEQAVALLRDMVSIPSLCGREDALAGMLLDVMGRAGFEVEHDEVGNVVGTVVDYCADSGVGTVAPSVSSFANALSTTGRGSSRTKLDRSTRRAIATGGIAGRTGTEPQSLHLPPVQDVQDLGCRVAIVGHMDTVPGDIPVEQRDGRLYGRGAVDAKGPLAAAIVAAARAGKAGVRVVGCVQEEGPSLGARHLAHRPPPEYLIIAEPSNWDAVVLGYKGSQRFTVRIEQPSSHTSRPEPTASERAVAFWQSLVGWCEDVATGPHAASAGTFERLTPTLIGMHSEDNGMSDLASLHVGLRLPPGMTCEQVERGVRDLLPEAKFCFSQGEIAVRGEKTGPLPAAFLRSIREEGGKPRFKVKLSTSDMNVLGPGWGCPVLAYGPGDSHLDHTPEEHIEIEEYLRGIRVLTRVLQEL